MIGTRTLPLANGGGRQATARRRVLQRRALRLADVVGLSTAFVLAEVLFGTGGPALDSISPQRETLLFLATLPLWIVVAKLYGLYDQDERRAEHWTFDDLVGVFHLVTIGAWLFFAGAWVSDVADPQFGKVAFFWALAIAFVTLARACARTLCGRHAGYLQNAVIVGAGDVGQTVATKFLQHPEAGVNVVGFVDRDRPERREAVRTVPHLGWPDELPRIIGTHEVDRVVIAFSSEGHDRMLDIVRGLKDLDVKVDIVPRLFEVLGTDVDVHAVGGMPLVAVPTMRLSKPSRVLKRALDVLLSTVGLLVLLPLLLAAAVAIKLDSPGPVFFRQVRMGSRQETFEILKFRTMAADADEHKSEYAHLSVQEHGDPRMFKIENDPRVTRVGSFLRRYFIDELPQLVNVLRGDMSIVGPRPLILEEHEHVESWAMRRLDLKPGITGPWQVHGRNLISFEEMVKLDFNYVTNWSLWNDLRLICRTIAVALRASGD